MDSTQHPKPGLAIEASLETTSLAKSPWTEWPEESFRLNLAAWEALTKSSTIPAAVDIQIKLAHEQRDLLVQSGQRAWGSMFTLFKPSSLAGPWLAAGRAIALPD